MRGRRKAKARKTWTLIHMGILVGQTKAIGREHMQISVIMSTAVMACQRKNCETGGIGIMTLVTMEVYKTGVLPKTDCFTYLIWTLGNVFGCQYSRMITVDG